MDRKLQKLLDKARASANKGKVRAALSYYQKASKHAPRDPVSWQELGEFLLTNNDVNEGVDALFRAADLYAQVGAPNYAIPLCKQVLSIDSNHGGAHNVLRVIERRASLRRQATAQPVAPPEVESPETIADLPEPSSADTLDPPPATLKPSVLEVSSDPSSHDLGEGVIQHLTKVAPAIRMSTGDVVFSQGDSGSCLYFVLEGAVEVLRNERNRERVAATLKSGALFGEMALLGGPPRTATVQAKQPTILLEISQSTVRELIKKDGRVLKVLIQFFRDRMVDNLIATSPFLSHLSLEQRRSIAARFRVCDLPNNQVVIMEHEPATSLYLVLAGTLSVWATRNETKNALGRLVPGDVFGEMALLDSATTSATVRTDERVWLLRLPGHDFETLMIDHPSLRAELRLIAKSRRQHNQNVLQST